LYSYRYSGLCYLEAAKPPSELFKYFTNLKSHTVDPKKKSCTGCANRMLPSTIGHLSRGILYSYLVGGFNPSEKYYCSQIGNLPQIEVKIKNIGNHHPE